MNVTACQPTVDPPAPADQLYRCHLLLWTLAVACALIMGAILLDGNLRGDSPARPSAALVRTLALSDLSLIPCGRPPRHPKGDISPLDGRFCARLPRMDTQFPDFLLTY